jgi:AraC-like DNA-binding protein
MMNFVTRALKGKTARTEREWRDLVSKNWSMRCEFINGVQRQLLAAFWFMGDVRFETADLSHQQWTWEPGPGLDNWRSTTLIMLLIESGSIDIEQDGTSVSLIEGSLLLFDGGIKYTQTSGKDCRGVFLRIPKTSLETRGKVLSSRDMFVPDPASHDVALLKSLIAGTTAYGEQCSPYGGRLVAEHLTDLMEIVTDDLSAPQRLKSSDVMRRRVKRFIERNLGNEHTDFDMVAAAMGVSKRYLTKLFERDGSSVTRYLLEQRLARAKRILTSGGGAHLRISDVAWQCGFVNAAHFSTAFKKQFGVSPTDVQRGYRAKMETEV